MGSAAIFSGMARLITVLAILLAGACTPTLPSMEHPLDASEALDILFAGTDAAHPPVYGVPSDCSTEPGAWGFTLDGGCHAGLTDPDAGVFVVIEPPTWVNLWSRHLAHEAVGHWAVGGNMDPDHAGPAFQPGGAVDQAKARLLAKPAVNAMEVSK
jgi:hypothetical protein